MKTPLAILFLLVALLPCKPSIAQENNIETIEVRGVLLDANTQKPLMYAGVYSLGEGIGSISNETGLFSLRIRPQVDDSIRFQHMGYRQRVLSVEQLLSDSIVYLVPEILNLNEFLVFSSPPKAEDIVKRVVERMEENYRPTTSLKKAFVRLREENEMGDFDLSYKKSTIEGVDWRAFDEVNQSVPKTSQSYSDILADFYFDKNDKEAYRWDPERIVTLQEEDIAEPTRMMEALESALKNTGQDEYWKFKTGIIGVKMDGDSLDIEEAMEDAENGEYRISEYGYALSGALSYSRFENEDEWQFLFSPRKYSYEIRGGTRLNDETVYIIDFSPRGGALFEGTMYISTDTYALVRADYHYASADVGKNIDLLGFGYTQKGFQGSILFEPHDGNYRLKYISRKAAYQIRVHRDFALLKKRERFLFDKKLQEVKMGLDLQTDVVESVEFLVLSDKAIEQSAYDNFKQPRTSQVIEVEQFSDELWKDYNIIAPTEQMKNYKKRE